MPSTELSQPLRRSTAEVLETMCFMGIVDPVEDETESPADWITASLSFQGGERGKFAVVAPWPVAQTMAANLLGEEMDVIDRQQAAECLGEIANMICGGFVHDIGKSAVYELSHPNSEFTRTQPGAGATVERVQLDEGPVIVWAELE